MKDLLIYLSLFFFISSCSNNTSTDHTKTEDKERVVFFPVTVYLKGQIVEIKERGVTPLKYLIKGKKIDSSWLNMDHLAESFSDFLLPEIDSLKLHDFFSVKEFYDQTLDKITLTYEAKKDIPDQVKWLSWNIYINPEKGTVDRIYLVKRVSDKQTSQLTWIPYKNCKLTNIYDDGDTAFVESEVKIKWDY